MTPGQSSGAHVLFTKNSAPLHDPPCCATRVCVWRTRCTVCLACLRSSLCVCFASPPMDVGFGCVWEACSTGWWLERGRPEVRGGGRSEIPQKRALYARRWKRSRWSRSEFCVGGYFSLTSRGSSRFQVSEEHVCRCGPIAVRVSHLRHSAGLSCGHRPLLRLSLPDVPTS